MAFGGESAESYYDDGLTAYMRGEYERAEQCFEQAVKLDNTFTAAWHQLGKCLARRGELRRAADTYVGVIRANPRQIAPRIDLGHVLLQMGRTEEARKVFNEVSTVEPENSRALLGLAYVAFHEAQWDQAASRARASLQHSGPNFPALFLLGRASKLSGDETTAQQSLDEAEALVKNSQELSPDYPESYYLCGEVYFIRGRYGTALEYYRDATDRAESGKSYSAFGERFTRLDLVAKQGLCFMKLGQRDRARELGRDILTKDPNHKLGKALAEED